jgi:hypothetical protein
LFPEDRRYLAGLGVSSGGQLAVDKLAIHAHFEAASVGGDDPDGFDFGFEFLQQVGRQTDGPVGVVSNRAINDFHFDHGSS